MSISVTSSLFPCSKQADLDDAIHDVSNDEVSDPSCFVDSRSGDF